MAGREVRVPASLLGPSGSNVDIADKLANWLRSGANVPSGPSATEMTRVVLPTGVFRNEGGTVGAVTLDRWKNVKLEGNTHFVQRTRKPFVVVADPSNGSLSPTGKWNIWYTPTSTLKLTYEGRVAGADAFERANDKCWSLNRARDFFRLRKCERVCIALKMTGCAGLDPPFNANYEAQNGLSVYGCKDIEVTGRIDQTLGNGVEGNFFREPDGFYTPTSGLWIHDAYIHHFGRQVGSFTYGGNYIVERCDMGNTGRSMIDMEPTTNRNPPGQEATVEGVYILNNVIGSHRLGMVAAGFTHGDVRNIRVAGNRGKGIGTSGVMFSRRVIYEDNVDTDRDQSPNAVNFAKGPDWGGEDIIVRRNTNHNISEAGAKFHGGNGGCTNYLAVDNDFRRDGSTSRAMPQFLDTNVPKWSGTFTPFSLPTPPHALRDL